MLMEKLSVELFGNHGNTQCQRVGECFLSCAPGSEKVWCVFVICNGSTSLKHNTA